MAARGISPWPMAAPVPSAVTVAIIAWVGVSSASSSTAATGTVWGTVFTVWRGIILAIVIAPICGLIALGILAVLIPSVVSSAAVP